MRARLVRSILGIALLAVVLLGVPLALLARHQVGSSAQDRLDTEASAVLAALEDRLDAGRPITVDRVVQLAGARHVRVTTAAGQVVSGGPAVRGPILTSTVTVGGSTVVVQTGRSETIRRQREVTLLVAGLGLAAVVAAVGLALAQARRLGAPLAHLADRADALGQGDFTPAPLSSGIPEVDTISRQLERSAAELADLIARQREFASDAAHQLRTPLTGIGLRLEEISLLAPPEVASEAEEALLQVERLDQVITSLLARARGDAEPAAPVELNEVVRADTSAWDKVVTRRGRTLTVSTPQRSPVVLGRRGHLSSILTSLLDNALVHGAGEVRVAVHERDGQAVLTVSDDGPGVPDGLVATLFDRAVSGSHGTGIGLALAQSLAVAEGGVLALSAQSRSELILTLPAIQGPPRRQVVPA